MKCLDPQCQHRVLCGGCHQHWSNPPTYGTCSICERTEDIVEAAHSIYRLTEAQREVVKRLSFNDVPFECHLRAAGVL